MTELLDLIDTLPEMDIGNRQGSTDYIDFIRPDDVSATCMQGTDRFNRNFITAKFTDHKNNKPFVWTLFQRYTDDSNYWTIGGREPTDVGFSGGINMSKPIDDQDEYKRNVLQFFLAAASGKKQHEMSLYMFDDVKKVMIKFL